MNRPSDAFGEMDEMVWPPGMRDPLHLDDGTVDRLLDGMPVDDAPPVYRDVAALLRTLNAPATADELAREHDAVAALAAPRRYHPSPQVLLARSTLPRRKTSSKRRLRVSGAALVGTAMVFVGLGAAGALPGVAQRVASDVLATVGIDAPNPNPHGDDNSEMRPASNNEPDGASATTTGGDDGATVSRQRTHGSSGGVDDGSTAPSGTAGASDDIGSGGGKDDHSDSPESNSGNGKAPNQPPGQSNAPNHGVGNGKGKGNSTPFDSSSDGSANAESAPAHQP